MQILISLQDYKPENGFRFDWEDGFDITIKKDEGAIHLLANKEGLISLAKHFLNLAQDHFPPGYHFHLDEINSLEEGSSELVVEKL